MTQERESKLPDDNSTQEIIREKTMQMTKNIRTGYYTVVMDPKYTARPSAPSGRREQVSSSCRAHKRAMFRKKTRDVDALISEQFVSTLKHVDYSTVQNFNKTCNLEDLYETGAVFAEGGQGVLRMAVDRELRRTAVVKTLKNADNPANLESFLREAKVTAQLDHPAILPIYSLNTDSGNSAHLVMRYIKGCNLKEYLERVDSFYRIDGVDSYDERRALFNRLDLFLRACDAMEYAHNRNIMHRDLKPENIMIGEYRDVYIMDWGIACPIIEPGYDPEKWVPPKTVMGTPRYISPEAVRGEHCDNRADIYALGLILYEIVTLNEAYSGITGEEVLERVSVGDMNLMKHRYGVPIDKDLFSIVMKATDPDQNNRYATVADFSADIRRYMRNEEVKANPDNWFTGLIRWCSRHPRMIAGISAAIIMLTILCASGVLIGRILLEKEYEATSNAVNQAFARNLFMAGKIEWLVTANQIKITSIQDGRQSSYYLTERQKIRLEQTLKPFSFLKESLKGQFIYRVSDGAQIFANPENIPLPEQLQKDMCDYVSGTYYTEKDDHYYLWCYIRMPSLKWVYLECFELESLRDHQHKMKKKTRFSGAVLRDSKISPIPF